MHEVVKIEKLVLSIVIILCHHHSLVLLYQARLARLLHLNDKNSARVSFGYTLNRSLSSFSSLNSMSSDVSGQG